MRTLKGRMKSLVVIEHDEIVLRRIVEHEEMLTVGNRTCDIPLPDEERILFAIELREDEVMAHIYMHERMALQVNSKRYEQGLIDIEPSSEIELRDGLSIIYIVDENLPESQVHEQNDSDTEIVEPEKTEEIKPKGKTILDFFPKKS